MHLHFDPPAGISGDMVLAALTDAGFDIALLHRVLGDRLPADTMAMEKVVRKGLTGFILKHHTRRETRLLNHFGDLGNILSGLDISNRVSEHVTAMYKSLYEAESAVHGTDLDRTHLHELASMDTLVDFLGVSLAMEALDIQTCSTGPVALGSGVVTSEHGKLPVPAPATLKLLEGIPVFPGRNQGEATTPTGAAILKEFLTDSELPTMRLEKSGSGFGTRVGDELPNCLRVFIGEKEIKSSVLQLEATMDDLTGQLASRVVAHLLKLGAMDAHFQPVTMKKGRPGLLLCILLKSQDLENILAAVFRETTTIGVRYFPVQRVILPREMVDVDTSAGRIAVKVSRFKGDIVNVHPEFSQVEKAAELTGRSVKEILHEVMNRYRDAFMPDTKRENRP